MEGVRRGDLITVVLPGFYGKPRPAVVVQTDEANPTHSSIVVCPFTSDTRALYPVRVAIEPTAQNNLQKGSVVMVDKISAVPRARLGTRFGHLTPQEMQPVNRALSAWLALERE
jgi:mRNA interferase MazF